MVILTLNEAERIRRCLSSIQISARVVILDSFSTDETLEVAQRTWQELGRPATHLATVTRAWQGFTESRNASLRWVQTPWTLWLDADEWLSPELNEELARVMAAPAEAVVYRMPRQSYFLGRAIRHGGWYPDLKRRLAWTTQAEWRSGPHGSDVHEDLHARDGSNVGTLQFPLEHESFRSVAEQAESNDRYSTLLAEGLARKYLLEKRRPPSRPYIVLKVAIKFLENYIFKLGILDARPGYLIARGSASSLKMRLEKTRSLMEKARL